MAIWGWCGGGDGEEIKMDPPARATSKIVQSVGYVSTGHDLRICPSKYVYIYMCNVDEWPRISVGCVRSERGEAIDNSALLVPPSQVESLAGPIRYLQ